VPARTQAHCRIVFHSSLTQAIVTEQDDVGDAGATINDPHSLPKPFAAGSWTHASLDVDLKAIPPQYTVAVDGVKVAASLHPECGGPALNSFVRVGFRNQPVLSSPAELRFDNVLFVIEP